MGLQQIITYQAQIALDEYNAAHQAQQESDIVTPPETLKESTKSEQKKESVTEPVQTEPVQTEPVQTEPVQTEPVQTEPIINCSGAAKCITGKVTKIIDGDTLYTESYTIRLSLTNTPEKDQLGFLESTQFTAKLCPVGSTITIDQDDLQPYDKYERLVGKVFCGDKVLNSELLDSGYADILTEYCSTSEFSKEPWAQQSGCATINQSVTPQIPKEIPKTSSDENNCDPSYPDVCIPPYPPDLDCKEIPYKKFKVLPSDPHGFDGNKDGIGCQ
jgi:micrococcal nuclease